jgi:hypothetical protein
MPLQRAKPYGVPKPQQGDKDEVPSGLGYDTQGPDSVEADNMAPFPRKAGLPEINYRGTFNMLNAIENESDPY